VPPKDAKPIGMIPLPKPVNQMTDEERHAFAEHVVDALLCTDDVAYENGTP
jgi:hypothetical protein